jgi:hypothetical protein
MEMNMPMSDPRVTGSWVYKEVFLELSLQLSDDMPSTVGCLKVVEMTNESAQPSLAIP